MFSSTPLGAPGRPWVRWPSPKQLGDMRAAEVIHSHPWRAGFMQVACDAPGTGHRTYGAHVMRLS